MQLKIIDPGTDNRWQNLVERYETTLFHSPEWIQVLKKTYDFDIEGCILINDDTPVAGIAYCSIEDMMDSRIISLPFSDFCDPLVQNQTDWKQLLDYLIDKNFRLKIRCLHNQVPLQDTRLNVHYRAKWHCVDLRSEPDIIWNNLHSSARRAIRKARRNQVEIRIAQDKKDLRAFFNLHLKLRKYKYHLLAQPYQFFENIWDQFIAKQNGALMLAYKDDEVIGGIYFIEWQGKLYYKFNASNPEFIAYRPNDLVLWEGIQYGHKKGLSYLDFGLSDWDQKGLLQYKRKYATEEKTISFLQYVPNQQVSSAEQQMKTLLSNITDLFVDEAVPDTISEQAGKLLYRYFL